MGNGTNDTDAMKTSDVSFSMCRTGTETAKEASAIVLLDDQFTSIIPTIKYGRNLFDSVRKFVQLQLTINFVAAAMAFLGGVFLGESPLNPMQMLWTNIVIDLIGSIAMITESPDKELMTRKPYGRREKILNSEMVKFISTQGVIQIVILSVLLFKGTTGFMQVPNCWTYNLL